MRANEHILDNRQRAVVDYLRARLPQAETFRLVSAYFSIYGYELLAQQLDSVGDVRFLYGDPGSVGEVDPGEKESKSYDLTEQGLVPRHTLRQKPLARRCADWVRRGNVAVRSVSRSNFLHGKMYLIDAPERSAGVVGSSNFTKRGLGGGTGANLEINLATSDPDTLAELACWFDDLWNDDSLTEDAKQQVLDALGRIGQDHAPELIYYKTLYELFKSDIEGRRDSNQHLQDIHLHDTAVWNALYEFQKDGVKSVITRLQRHNGCILADSVGLGKTYTALAVIKYYELRNERVLVLCPKKLRENWALYPAYMGQAHNPFDADRFGYTLLSHTDLSRERGMAGQIDLEHFNWGGYDLIVIDESHNFRNSEGSRYQRLIENAIQQGVKTKVLMLSATPVNTSLTDLRNQLYLMTEGRDGEFRESLGVGNVRDLMAVAQREFKQWETSVSANGRRDKAALLEQLGADFLRLLEGVSISRSRRHIEQFYDQEMARVGQFPNRDAPVNDHPPTDLRGELSYKALADQIGRFTLSVYQPSAYVVSEARLQELDVEKERRNFNQRDRERWLIAMMRTNFLKRLESSAHALTLTLGRTIQKIENLLERIARFEGGRGALTPALSHGERGPDAERGALTPALSHGERGADAEGERGLDSRFHGNDGGSGNDLQGERESDGTEAEVDQVDVRPDDDEEDEDLVINRGRYPYRLDELDLDRWKADLLKDKDTLTAAWDKVRAVTPERDGKLKAIRQVVRDKARQPTVDQDGKPNRKLLVFTTFKDTAEYLYDNLESLAGDLGVNMALVSGDSTRTAHGMNNYNAILSNFAPKARSHRVVDGREIDLLIATDCISEGQNLQDCDTVLNYDIHWNPVRIIQRFGRIDRIGSRSRAVRMLNYWPTKDMDEYLKLRNRVQARMALADLSASGDEDPFTEGQAQLELRFRDKQLEKLRQEVLDLEDLGEGISLSDLTLDQFFAQLLRFLETNRERLEATPNGAYAVTPAVERGAGAEPDDGPSEAARPGAIFFLRQRNAATDYKQKPVSPIHPFYLVYIQADGQIRYGCANTRQALNVFEAATVGKTEPIAALCDRFDSETAHGADMQRYDKLLTDAVAHIRQSHGKSQMRNLGRGGDRGFVLPKASETPRAAGDFELVTWLVIAPDRT